MPTDSTIKIKRSTGTTAPVASTDIVIGELATTMDSTNNGASNKVYLGIQNSSAGTSAVAIGGKYYTDAVDALAYFKTIAVTGQSNVVADTSISGDTLTLVAGSGITITTDAGTDTITVSSTDAGGTVTSITPAAGSGSGTAITTSGTITVTGTANEIETSVSGTTITVGLPNDVTVGGSLTVTGNLTINGTTTTVNSTTTSVDDPIFTLGGDSSPGSDDNKDRGIEFRWHNGSAAKLGFFGFDDTDSSFMFIPDATNTSEVFSGTLGDIKTNSVKSVSGTALVLKGDNTHDADLSLIGHASLAASAYAKLDAGYFQLNGTLLGVDGFLRIVSDPTGAAAGPLNGDLKTATLSAGRVWTMPDATGTVITTGNLSSITTVGTVSSGTWQGGVIGSTYGGTGVNNAGRTLTINTANITFDANASGSSVTLPVTGTLATLAGSETLTNKTLSTGSVWQGGIVGSTYGGTGVNNGSYTITLGGNISTAGSFTHSGAHTLTLTTTNNTNITLPTTGTLATLAGSETLSNKTIDCGTF
jgi:hypothetical protein